MSHRRLQPAHLHELKGQIQPGGDPQRLMANRQEVVAQSAFPVAGTGVDRAQAIVGTRMRRLDPDCVAPMTSRRLYVPP